jgi:hypothetical protein
MTIATADEHGRPWASPVWFAASGTDLLWVSDPAARHSRNLAVRHEMAAVIFDSTVPVGSAEAVYVDALAVELDGPELEAAIDAYSRRSLEAGAGAWTIDAVRAPARLRLYRGTVTSMSVLGDGDRRIVLQSAAKETR